MTRRLLLHGDVLVDGTFWCAVCGTSCWLQHLESHGASENMKRYQRGRELLDELRKVASVPESARRNLFADQLESEPAQAHVSSVTLPGTHLPSSNVVPLRGHSR